MLVAARGQGHRRTRLFPTGYHRARHHPRNHRNPKAPQRPPYRTARWYPDETLSDTLPDTVEVVVAASKVVLDEEWWSPGLQRGGGGVGRPGLYGCGQIVHRFDSCHDVPGTHPLRRVLLLPPFRKPTQTTKARDTVAVLQTGKPK